MDARQQTVSPARVPIRETWEQLESLVDAGIAKSIGVSNFQAQSLYDIYTYNKHPISSLQIEHHPYLVQPELVQMAQTHGIVVTAYSSFGPQSFLELPPAFKERASNVELLFDAEPVKKAATKKASAKKAETTEAAEGEAEAKPAKKPAAKKKAAE